MKCVDPFLLCSSCDSLSRVAAKNMQLPTVTDPSQLVSRLCDERACRACLIRDNQVWEGTTSTGGTRQPR